MKRKYNRFGLEDPLTEDFQEKGDEIPEPELMAEEVVVEPKAEAVMVTATVVKEWRGNALLEYELDGLLRRCYLPEDLVPAGPREKLELDLNVLESGAPFGDNLSLVLKLRCPTPTEAADFLRRRDIWRFAELMGQNLPSLLQALYQADAVIVQGRVRQQLNKRK